MSIGITATDAAQLQAVIDEVKRRSILLTGPRTPAGTLSPGRSPAQKQEVLKQQAVDQAMKIIDSRINAFGVKEPTLQRHGAKVAGRYCFRCLVLMTPNVSRISSGPNQTLHLMKVVSPPNPSPVTTYPTEEAAKQSLGGTVPAKPTHRFRTADRDEPTKAAAPTATPDPTSQKQCVVVEYPPIVDGSELREATANSRTRR